MLSVREQVMSKGALALLIRSMSENWSAARWKGRFDEACPGRRVLQVPEATFDPEDVHYAAVWKPLPGELALDTDLVYIFNVSKRKRKGVRPAADLLKENRKVLTDKVAYWTGVQRPLIKNLVESIVTRVGELGLLADVKNEAQYITEITAYATAMAMNYLTRGKFIQP